MNESLKSIASKPRISIDKNQRQIYVESFKKSNLTMTAFCHANKLALSSFCKWFHGKTIKPTTFKPLNLSPGSPPAIHQPHTECIELRFEGKSVLTFSNVKNPELIITIVKGLIK